MSNIIDNTTYLQEILDMVNNLEEKDDPVLQTKIVAPSTSSQSVTPDDGYDGLSEVTVEAMPTATQATPSISVSSGGLITSSATQSAGYVEAGTKSTTKQLTTQSAKTITPSTSSQTAVDSGVYTTGTVTVAAMPTATQATPSISVSSAGLITASSTQTAGYVASGTKSTTKQLTTQAAKTVTPSTSSQTAVASGVYTTGTVTVAAMPTATQATPSISVGTDGKITASATQTAGYVSAGTKTSTQQLTTQTAKTVTPTTSDQTAVASGVYTTGEIKVKGDSNLVAGNILSGKTIFGVNGGIPNNGTISKEFDGVYTKSATIPEGYTTGGTVQLDSTIDDEVSDQADLIAQCLTAIEGKVAGGAEDLSAEIAEYTELNDELESVINGLPSSGGSGGSAEFGYFSVDGWEDPSGSESYKIPFMIGQTWDDWVDTSLNIGVFTGTVGMVQLRKSNNEIKGTASTGMLCSLSASYANQGIVSLTDLIQNGSVYYLVYGNEPSPFD